MNRKAFPRVRDEQHLIELAGIPFTKQQLAAITADLDRAGGHHRGRRVWQDDGHGRAGSFGWSDTKAWHRSGSSD